MKTKQTKPNAEPRGFPVMEDLTVLEIRAYLERRHSILVPVGITEQHGYHLPLSTDALIATGLARQAGQRLGMLVAPTFTQCYSGGTLPGTINISPAVMALALGENLASLAVQGFRNFYLFLCHGGSENLRALQDALQMLLRNNPAFADALIALLPVWRLSSPGKGWNAAVADHDWHAGWLETSLVMHLAPDRVRLDQLELDADPRQRHLRETPPHRAVGEPQRRRLPDRPGRVARRDGRDGRPGPLPRAHVLQGDRAAAHHPADHPRARPAGGLDQCVHRHRGGRLLRRGPGDGDAPARRHRHRHAEPAPVRGRGGRAGAQRGAPGAVRPVGRPRRLDLGLAGHRHLRSRPARVVVGGRLPLGDREGDPRPAPRIPPLLLRAGLHVPGHRGRCPARARAGGGAARRRPDRRTAAARPGTVGPRRPLRGQRDRKSTRLNS